VFGDRLRFYGTIALNLTYIHAGTKNPQEKPGKGAKEVRNMKETKDVLRVVGIILLALFVLAVGVPLVLAAAGVALGVLGFLIGLAVMLIKVAIVVAIIYLIVVGIRAVLK